MFSNGSEYDSFLESNCFQCKKFVWFEDATLDKPCCPIEEQIALCHDKETFPYDKLIENKYMSRYTCKESVHISE